MNEEFKIGDRVVVNGYYFANLKDGDCGVIKGLQSDYEAASIDFDDDVDGWGDEELQIKSGHGVHVLLINLKKVVEKPKSNDKGINLETQTGRYFNALVEGLNSQIQLLKQAGIKIHDDNDFEFVIDYVYYSEAQDEVIVRFKGVRE
jgi:hypothetical protein